PLLGQLADRVRGGRQPHARLLGDGGRRDRVGAPLLQPPHHLEVVLAARGELGHRHTGKLPTAPGWVVLPVGGCPATLGGARGWPPLRPPPAPPAPPRPPPAWRRSPPSRG